MQVTLSSPHNRHIRSQERNGVTIELSAVRDWPPARHTHAPFPPMAVTTILAGTFLNKHLNFSRGSNHNEDGRAALN